MEEKAKNAVKTFEDLAQAVADSGRPYEAGRIEKAYEMAAAAHAGQTRLSGESYVSHPVAVACLVVDLGLDTDSVVAALLHDSVEDTETTAEDVKAAFGPDVALLVDGVTKLGRIKFSSVEEQQAENLRKMLLAMSKDVRVMLIKLCDRLHNMRTGDGWPEQKRRDKALETMEVYAPIAHRLGMSNVKEELEDRSLQYLDPVGYEEITSFLAQNGGADSFISGIADRIKERLAENGMDKCTIKKRIKSVYGIYRKMYMQNRTFEEIYDVYAVRIILDTVGECYNALGVIHDMYHPIPSRFKDYISTPKPNMYQSLHTTVIGHEGIPFEVQIRTWEMDQTAEYGVAAHWKYKAGVSTKDKLDDRIAWVRQLLESQRESEDAGDLLRDIKSELLPEEVFAFTPKGDVINLPAGATVIDFAYAIHTEVGNHCVGAKVNGSIVPLSYQLQVGDRVEVLTQKSASPSRDWLNIVKTPSARSKIRSYFSKITRSDDMQMGRDMLVREMRKHGLGLSSAQSMRALKLVAEALGFKDPDEMYVHIGTGKEKAQHVTNRLLKILVDKGNEEAEKPTVGTSASSTGIMAPMLTSVKRPKKHETHSSQGIVVKGVDDVLVRLSRCCNPVPGDDILGFVTRGRGVSVHRADCPNALDLKRHPERIIEVEWEGTPTAATYQVEIYIEALDRMNLLLDVTRVISEMGANVLSCNTTTHRDGMVEMRFLFQLSDLAVIERMTKRLSAIDGVFDARRMMPQGSSKKG